MDEQVTRFPDFYILYTVYQDTGCVAEHRQVDMYPGRKPPPS